MICTPILYRLPFTAKVSSLSPRESQSQNSFMTTTTPLPTPLCLCECLNSFLCSSDSSPGHFSDESKEGCIIGWGWIDLNVSFRNQGFWKVCCIDSMSESFTFIEGNPIWWSHTHVHTDKGSWVFSNRTHWTALSIFSFRVCFIQVLWRRGGKDSCLIIQSSS